MIDKKRIHGLVKKCAGEKFRNYTVLEIFGVKKRSSYWWCSCDCGEIRIISKHYLKQSVRLEVNIRCSSCKRKKNEIV